MLRGVLLVAVGLSLIAFHRPIARYQRSRWNSWQHWPLNRLLATPPLLAYTVPLLVVGLVLLVLGVLSLTGVIHWKE
jgi:hypothetical protein